MDDWEWVFFYDEENDSVAGVSTYHQQECDIGSLVEAHPDVIYFYAEFGPLKEWNYNEVAHIPVDPEAPRLSREMNYSFRLPIFVEDTHVTSADVYGETEPPC